MGAERVTYCRICEPLCGLVATVEDGRLVRLRSDEDHPLSRGFAVKDGAPCRITSPHGSVELPARLTDDMAPGTVAVPHGWGHRGGWRLAEETGGANVNLLSSSAPADLERLAGMAHLNGIPVRVEPA